MDVDAKYFLPLSLLQLSQELYRVSITKVNMVSLSFLPSKPVYIITVTLCEVLR